MFEAYENATLKLVAYIITAVVRDHISSTEENIQM